MNTSLPATMESVASDKIWSTVAIGAAGFIGAFLPRCVGTKREKLLSGGNLFSAGVLLSAGLVHLLPDAIDGAREVEPDLTFPLMESIAGIGFLLVMAVELLAPKMCSSTVSSCGCHGHSTSSATTPNSTSLQSAYDIVGKNVGPDNSEDDNDNDDFEEEEEDSEGETQQDDRNPTRGEPPSICSSVTLLLALSFHSVIEGVALGAACDTTAVIQVLSAVVTHKWLAGFALGSQFVKAQHKCLGHAVLTCVFAMATPVGAGIGAIMLAGVYVAGCTFLVHH